MTSFLKVNSVDARIKKVLIDTARIESIFEYDRNSNPIKNSIEDITEPLYLWGTKVVEHFLAKKDKTTFSLVEEFLNIKEEIIEKLEEEDKRPTTNHTVIKMGNGNFYTCSETLTEIEEQMEEMEYNKRLGLNI